MVAQGNACAPVITAMSAADCKCRYSTKTRPPSTATPIIPMSVEKMTAAKINVWPLSERTVFEIWNLRILFNSVGRTGAHLDLADGEKRTGGVKGVIHGHPD